MDVMDAIFARRSIRSFLPKSIEPEKLERVLDAGRQAPSASNQQPWRLVVVTDPLTRQRLAHAARDQKFVGDAPAVLVGCAITSDRIMTCGQHCYPIDLAICLTTISLAAVSQGLGTCWVGAFFENQVKEILGIPADVRVVELMPIGYPAENPSAHPRKPMAEFAVINKWA